MAEGLRDLCDRGSIVARQHASDGRAFRLLLGLLAHFGSPFASIIAGSDPGRGLQRRSAASPLISGVAISGRLLSAGRTYKRAAFERIADQPAPSRANYHSASRAN